MNGSAKKRALAACCVLAFGFTGFSWRLVDIQVGKHDFYSNLAAESHGGKQAIYARRGAILDACGQPLAQNDPVRTVVADASLIKDRAELARILSGPLELSEAALVEKLSREHWSEKRKRNEPSQYIVLRKNLPEAVANELGAKLAELKIRAVGFEQDSIRIYPNREMLCHVLGFLGFVDGHKKDSEEGEKQALEGVERTMDSYLRGRDGVRYTEHDRTGKELVPYRGQERPAQDGCNVRLTIDLNLQDIVESELASAVKQYHPNWAAAIVMRPQTGDILSMANWPAFDPNKVDASPIASRRNRAITDMVEPGSTFKIVVVSGALHEHLVHPTTMIPTENGYFNFKGRLLKDTHAFPELSVHDILVHSSNIGAAKLGIQLGDQRLYEYMRRFGFGDRTGVQLPGEIVGLVHPVYKWTPLSISRIPMGQEVCVTPLQVATAMCVIANGGALVMPQIVHDVVDSEGKTVASFPPITVRRVISPEVAAEMRDALIDVMGKKGTGKSIRVMGFTAAGKTGTAQRVAEGGGGYEKGKYVVSFVGFVPAVDPQFVCLVMLDDAKVEEKKNYGGTVAGPVFAKIAERTARHLGMEQDHELLAQQTKAIELAEHAND